MIRRASIVRVVSAGASPLLAAACNGLLGNADHLVAVDASTDATSSDSGSSSGVDSGSGSGVDSGSGSGVDSGSSSGVDSGSSSGTDSGPGDGGADAGCTQGATRCSGNAVQTCSGGTWGSPVPCATSQSCAGGTCSAITSCAPGGAGMTNCGSGATSCCTSLEVPGGTFDRSYDGFTYTDSTNPATVSGFRLDKYEVTVGRFHPFVTAVVGGWLPASGSGKHTHLSGGQGLAATGGGYETGWDATWNGNLATTAGVWDSNLGGGTWTAPSNENLPITMLDWYEAYAFCIWDGGFLPSEAEWNDAAAGGSDQRAYPWSPKLPPGDTSITCTQANYMGCPGGAANAVGSEPAGDARWLQSDLAGNVWEWILDSYVTSYVTPCVDCANFSASANRGFRGGSFGYTASNLLASTRNGGTQDHRSNFLGLRCARTP